MVTTLTNSNYCASVVEISKLIDLDNCDNVRHANIFGNLVIVSKDVKVGDVGIYFPVECKLSKEFLSNNNLYRHSENNINQDKKGYFEDNGRIKAVKFRGNASSGLFMPLSSLDFVKKDISLNIGDEFNSICGIDICEKYMIKINKPFCKKCNAKKSKEKLKSKVVDGQFNYHYDTTQLGKNIHLIAPDSLISITSKFHGTSGVVSNVLVKKELNLFEKFLKFVGVKIVDKEYDILCSSRRVIKNEYFDNRKTENFYDDDIWSITAREIFPYTKRGMSVYYEIVGYTPSGSPIQGSYDYGCNVGEYKVFIYRITNTNIDGDVFEYSAKQVQDWCKSNGFNPVVELYYGYAGDLFKDLKQSDEWRDLFFDNLKNKYLEKQCSYCNNNVPDEGIVVRLEDLGQAFKLKSFKFLQKETKDLDSGKTNMEDDN